MFVDFFQKVVEHLKKQNLEFALAGGVVASMYREQERTTKDLDFLLLAGTETSRVAEDIIRTFDLKPYTVRKADIEGGPLFAIKKKSTEPYIIVGRDKDKPSKIGLDFILPSMPWFDFALKRSQNNLIDFGFGLVACLTVEDIIISKLLAVKNSTTRFKDLDDLQSIFLADHKLDKPYLKGKMQLLKLRIPKLLKGYVSI